MTDTTDPELAAWLERCRRADEALRMRQEATRIEREHAEIVSRYGGEPQTEETP